jgi:hypothetical protein
MVMAAREGYFTARLAFDPEKMGPIQTKLEPFSPGSFPSTSTAIRQVH